MLTLLHIGSRLFELLSKMVRVQKQPGRPLNSHLFDGCCSSTTVKAVYTISYYILHLLFSFELYADVWCGYVGVGLRRIFHQSTF